MDPRDHIWCETIGPDKDGLFTENCIYFLTHLFKRVFGCLKEPSYWDSSFEYPQHMFWLRNKKNNFQIRILIRIPGDFINCHTLSMPAAKALVILRRWAGSSAPKLLAVAIWTTRVDPEHFFSGGIGLRICLSPQRISQRVVRTSLEKQLYLRGPIVSRWGPYQYF